MERVIPIGHDSKLLASDYSRSLVLATFDFKMGEILNGSPLEWNLSDVNQIDPYGLVGMACILSELSRRGHKVSLTLPQDEVVKRFMVRMRLTEVLEMVSASVQGVWPPASTGSQADHILELRAFHDTRSGEKLANLIFDRLEGNSRPEVATALFEAAVELSMNAAEHAKSPGDAYMAAYTHRRGTGLRA